MFVCLFKLNNNNNNNNNGIGAQPKKMCNDKRKAQKRKIAELLPRDEENSCCSSSEEDAVGRKQHFPSLSPASSSCQSTLPPSPPKTGGNINEKSRTAASDPNAVKELEHAMSKHLPPTADKTSAAASGVAHQPTDFSTDALLKQQQQKTTIQWIGAHQLGQHHHHHHQQQQPQQQHVQHQHHHHPAAGSHHHHPHHHQIAAHNQLAQSNAGAPGTLPASALLRQIYANRESVIRANVHAPRSPGGSVGIGGTAAYYAGEMGTLPTPPGSEGGYGEQQFGPQKNDFGSAVGSLVVPPPYNYADYHTAMTPPSSVSPRDKHQQQQQQHQQQQQQQQSYDLYGPPPTASDATLLMRQQQQHQQPHQQQHHHHQYGHHAEVTSSIAPPTLPLKPQPYNPAPPTVSLEHYDQSSAAAAAAAAAFYHSTAGFHLYHPSTASKSSMVTGPPPPPPPSSVYATDSLKNHHNWYSTPT